SPDPIVCDYDRLLSEQYALQSPVRAYSDTDLFAEEGKYPIEDTGKADHARKARVILRRRLMNNFPGLVYADQVRHYRMGDEDRNADEDHVLKRLLLDFVKVPGRLCQSPLRTHVTFNPVLDLAEHHFHKDRLRTGPSTPYPPEDYCKEDDEDEEGNEGNREEDEILGPEGLAEDD